MPSKVRVIFEHGGSFYTGSHAGDALAKYLTHYMVDTPPKSINGKKWERVIEMFSLLRKAQGPRGINLWIFRERKKIQFKKSRYKNLCEYWGCARERGRGNLVARDVQGRIADILNVSTRYRPATTRPRIRPPLGAPNPQVQDPAMGTVRFTNPWLEGRINWASGLPQSQTGVTITGGITGTQWGGAGIEQNDPRNS